MASHPINLAVRFLLELLAGGSLAYWGWTHSAGLLRFVLTLGLPLGTAIVWGTFAVPNDPSRSGRATVPVPGIVRLGLELAIFGAAVWALYSSGVPQLSAILGIVGIIHYLISYDRVAWLLQQ